MYIRIGDELVNFSIPKIMGILNVTPDSFSDGGEHYQRDAALRHTEKMIHHGATIIDVGGESTRPGSAIISVDEELDRVIPVVEAISKYFEVLISVDTSRPEVIRESAKAGAHIINDIRALSLPGALEAAAQSQLAVCLMHMQGDPQTMQDEPHYNNVLNEICDFFAARIKQCTAIGMETERLILDPGFGFGKTLYHNYHLLANFSLFHRFERPLLVGLSRKSMIGKVLNVPPKERIIGSVSGAVIAAMQGAHIIRVHDVKETVDAIRIVEVTLSAKDE